MIQASGLCYQCPSEKYVAGLAMQVPDDFRFTFKVTDDITLKRFPNLPRFGMRAGQPNQHFLDADLFQRAFLAPCETVRPKVKLEPLVTSSARALPGYTVGVPQEGSSSRDAFHTVWPLFKSTAIRKEPFCWSH
ncbi:MAG: hypothetical protein RL514_4282 [Verrucomicrobiota bacterium]